jgi:hypothetical protein
MELEGHGLSPLASRHCSFLPHSWPHSVVAPFHPMSRHLFHVGKEWRRWSRTEGREKVRPWLCWGRVAAAEQYRAHPPVHSLMAKGLRSAGKATRGDTLDVRHGRTPHHPRFGRLPPPPATAYDSTAAQEKGKESSGSSLRSWSSYTSGL